jgi:hypothetical protein
LVACIIALLTFTVKLFLSYNYLLISINKRLINIKSPNGIYVICII